ncbi:MAG: hypothetical protein A2Y82_02080 [Candidatus Buchananbacteria bacterium RBG_13_36_9]|uniref:Nudix hydrolase domain-containing protein n=1 Tax=Candidatus Buchananbacteria bacterium RBG_13_36_9 TaxID=1797530 RepID=A0A1G1XNI9_9BACT|nr:MAG: hypothetical protein A2Y82_02080 [Candidatus Buchananbacteria bacterium RBG_13_36_9]
MYDLSLEKLDSYRRQGYRPQAVGCFINDKRVLLLYKREHGLWQFPQGGIDNQETPKQALIREMNEELGLNISPYIKEIQFLGENKVNLPGASYRQRDLKTDQGNAVFMKGKRYFIFAIATALREINIADSEFDKYVWADYVQARKLAESIYQRGKKRITVHALDLLKENKFIE